jgi:RNA polymerase sigma-70 factor (ECF subfamily)
MECGSLLPLFFFETVSRLLILLLAAKLCPLESIIYESPSLQVLSFGIHPWNGGLGAFSLQLISLRLFGTLARIPVRMTATTSCLTPHGSSSFAIPATPGPTFFFSTLMGDEAKSIARGLEKRDPDLLDRLIEQYQYRLYRYLVYVTGNKERAEDFFQETWIRVLERGHQYDGKSRFEAWLFAIARHLVIDWQRSKKAQSLDTLTDPEQEHPLQLVNESDPSPLQHVLSHETEENVQSSLQRIPAIYREVLVLRFQEELQIEEMAGVLSVPLSTVKSRLYRGLEALRGALQAGAA